MCSGSPLKRISPARGWRSPEIAAQDGALPGAVGADEGHHLALLHVEGDVLDREDPALVADGDVLHLKHGSDPPGRPG